MTLPLAFLDFGPTTLVVLGVIAVLLFKDLRKPDPPGPAAWPKR